jgi:hypothetical protein
MSPVEENPKRWLSKAEVFAIRQLSKEQFNALPESTKTLWRMEQYFQKLDRENTPSEWEFYGYAEELGHAFDELLLDQKFDRYLEELARYEKEMGPEAAHEPGCEIEEDLDIEM